MKRRRGNNEGTIYKKIRNGREVWCAQISLGYGYGADGKRRRRRTLYATTQANVMRQLDTLRREVAEGIVAEPGNLVVADLCSRYAEHARRSVRPTTAAIYRHSLEHHVEPRIGGIRLARLQPVHLLDWLATLEKAGVQPRALQLAFDVLRRCLGFGVGAGLLSRNPAAGISRPRAPKPEVRSLTAAQAKALLAEARRGPAWVEAAVALGLCGLRRGETFGLAWRDVGTDAVRVRQALTETMDGERAIGELKSKSARREVPLPTFARAALARHRAALGAIPHPTLLVFQTGEGTPVRFSNFTRRVFKPLAKRAGLPSVTYHALRHTAATLLLASGVDVKTAQTVLGHARASHTLDVYADAVPGNVDAAMEQLGAML